MKSQVLNDSNTGFSICIHCYRQDASNTRQKLVALELDSSYISNVTEDLQDCLNWGHFTRLRRLADLGIVGDESGYGCAGVTLRGLKSLGCPSWRDIQEAQGKRAE